MLRKKPSKGKLLYQQVCSRNAEGIRALHLQGADLEWTDKEGKTPLIVACMKAELYHIAELLIELGSNVNASPPAPYDYTPLQQAAFKGLENTAKLLLLNGVNDCQEPLQIAKNKGFSNVVRAIESHICLFSGWMREFYSPAFLGQLVPNLRSRKVWVVIVPAGSHVPFTLMLAVYTSLHDAQPRTAMNLWVPNFQESNEWQSTTSATITDQKTSLTLAPATEGDSQQLKWFCDTCKGIPKPMQPLVVLRTSPTAPPLTDYVITAMEEGQNHHPASSSTLVDVPSSSSLPAATNGGNNEAGSSRQCAICRDAPSDAVCVPCGHSAGCMSCLKKIKSKKWGCPVCRVNINEVIRLYLV